MKLILPNKDKQLQGTVLIHKGEIHVNPIRTSHKIPLLDTRVYEVELSDGTLAEYTANEIAVNLLSQVDDEGHSHAFFDGIIDHKFNQSEIDETSSSKSTKGWSMLIQWKDGSTSWEKLSDIKECFPVQTAEYSTMNNIHNEPSFKWWVPYTLKKKNRIIARTKSRYWKRRNKFGIELPKSIEEALELDRKNGNTYWHDAIKKEMDNVKIAFNILDNKSDIPLGYKSLTVHMVFDVKMDFTRKARLVGGGHLTDEPSSMTYSSVVIHDSVRIAFTIAALNDLDVLSADVGNAYLNAKPREKYFIVCGPEFGSDAGKYALIVRALYGLKSAGASWRAHFVQTLSDMEFISCSNADADVWRRATVKPNGFKYYEYILVYVDDLLLISHNAKALGDYLKTQYRFKDEPAKPTRYLGADIEEIIFPSEPTISRWGMSSYTYLKDAIMNLELELKLIGKSLSNKCKTPLPIGYRPELDITPFINEQQTNYYQCLIGILL